MGRSRRGLSLWHVVATLPWIVAVLVARSSIGDNSFLWHITAGRLQTDAKSVLTADPFSIITRGAPWRTQSWLADVLYAWLDGRFDLGFVPWLRFGAAVALFAVVALIAWRFSRSIAAVAAVSFLTALLAVPYLNPRPVLFSYVLLALVVLVEGRPRLRWTLVPIFYLWASLHGSWVIGAGYLVLSVLEKREYRRIRSEAPWILAATLLTAHGWGVVDYLAAFGSSSSALNLITEWAAPDLLTVARLPFTVGLFLLMLGATRGAITSRQMLFALPLVIFALTSSRSVLPAFIMLLPLVASSFGAIAGSALNRPLRGVPAILVAIFVLPMALPVTGGLDTSRFPTELMDELGSRRSFHDDIIGGYLIYRHWPETPVLIDDRAELYGDELARFVDVRSGDAGWREYFDEFGLDVAIVRSDQALAQLLDSDGWRRAKTDADDRWVLMERG